MARRERGREGGRELVVVGRDEVLEAPAGRGGPVAADAWAGVLPGLSERGERHLVEVVHRWEAGPSTGARVAEVPPGWWRVRVGLVIVVVCVVVVTLFAIALLHMGGPLHHVPWRPGS
jgi:hypothetical protein